MIRPSDDGRLFLSVEGRGRHVPLLPERRNMGFISGELGAFENLMRERPSASVYESGDDGRYGECRSCRYHHPDGTANGCRFRECPYEIKVRNRPARRRKNGLKGGK